MEIYIEKYVDYLKNIKKSSENTVASYQRDLVSFLISTGRMEQRIFVREMRQISTLMFCIWKKMENQWQLYLEA